MAESLEFDWDEANTVHLAAHRVTPFESEQALTNESLDLDFEVINGEPRYRSIGIRNKGRILVVAWTIRGDKFGLLRRSRAAPRPARLSGEIKMKKQNMRRVPAFATEAEEAEWWHSNRKKHDHDFVAAVKTGEAKTLTAKEIRRRIDASKKIAAPVVSLRIPAADLALARRQAEQRGLPYETYIKSLLHETLAQRAKRKAG